MIRKLGELPPLLYKYYDIRQMPHAALLRDSQIYFASPAVLNDPFEFPVPSVLPAGFRHRCESFLDSLLAEDRAVLDTWEKGNRLDFLDRHDPFASLNLIGRSIAHRYEPDERWVEDIVANYIAACVGVFCLGGSHKSTLMWSHYAAQHSGICVAFSTDALLEVKADYIGPVVYDPELPSPSDYPANPADAILIGAAFRKAPEWGYEQEYRMLRMFARDRIATVPRDAIKKVYLGCRTGWRAQSLLEIRDSVLPHAQFYRAVKSPTHFGLFFEEL